MNYEIVPENERAYFDTSVWVALMLGNVPYNKGYVFAQDKFRELKNNAFHVYVSDLVLMEATWAIRKRVAEHEDATTPLNSLENKIKKEVEKFYREIEVAQNAGTVTVENPKDSMDWFLQLSHSVSNRPQTNALLFRPANKRYRYAGTGFLDFQHALIATRLMCARFYSADKGFERLKSMQEFKTLAIVTP